jgi:hypothetical protein
MMNQMINTIRFPILVSLLAGCAFAQSNPLTQAVMTRYNSVKQNLLDTAALMPDADYQYKLTPEQRAFSGWIGHTATGNYSYCAAIQGAAAPDMAQLHDMTAKADLVKALKESFDTCDAALKQIDDQKALTEKNGKYPVNAMVGLVCSLNEHYGNLVGYLRSKGLTPPSSARTKK